MIAPEPHNDSPPNLAPEPPLSRRQTAVQFLANLTIPQMTLGLVLAIFLWQWFDAHHQISVMQQELARKLAEMDGNNKASQAQVKQSQETVSELTVKVGSLENKYAEFQSQRTALETLYQEMSNSRDETALAEVEQLLLIASQQLQLSANVKAALVAMQQADNRLQRLDHPALNGLRKTINHDMDRLRTLPNLDLPGLTLKLDNLIAGVESLPLGEEIRPPKPVAEPVAPAQENAGQKLLREFWQEARKLVRIQDTQKRELPLLSPTESFFLRENLKLRLLSARLALLSRDETSFRKDIKTAQDWLKRYFDVQSADGQQAAQMLAKLQQTSISIELPDVAASIEAVRSYRAAHDKGGK